MLARYMTDDIHLSREILRAVDDGTLPSSLLDEIKTEHLLNRCHHCRAEVQAYHAERRAGVSVVRRVLQALSALLERLVTLSSREDQRARRDLLELLSLIPEERKRRVEQARSRFRSPALAKLLLAESRRCPHSEAFHLAELARTVVNRNPRMLEYFDLYALATACMANACRAGGDLRSADQLFVVVRQIMAEHGVTDPAIVARVDDLLGSLRKDQRRFAEAERLLRRAAMLFGLIRAWDDVARVTVKLGITYRLQGNLPRAIDTTRSALELLGPEADLKLHVAGHYNLILQMVEAGRFEEAAEFLEADAGLFARVQEPWLQIRLLWLRGDIASGRGDLAAAEEAYLGARDGFIAQGIGYDAAIVSLDLAVLYLRQGRMADVRRIAEEMLPVFQAQDVHREALAALALFQEAARQERLSLEQALEVATFLRTARHEPDLRFSWKPR